MSYFNAIKPDQNRNAAAGRAQRGHPQGDNNIGGGKYLHCAINIYNFLKTSLLDYYGDEFPLAILNIYGQGLEGGLFGGGFAVPFPQFGHWPQYQHQHLPAPNVDAMPALVPEPHVEEMQVHEGYQLEDQLHNEPEIIERGGEIGGIQAPRTPPRASCVSQLPSPPPTAPGRRTSNFKSTGYSGKNKGADVKPVHRTASPNRLHPPSTSPGSEPKEEMVTTSSSTTSVIRDLTHKGRKHQRDLNQYSSSNIKEEKPEPVDANKSPSNNRSPVTSIAFDPTSSPGTSAGTQLKRKLSPPVDIDLTIGDDSDDCLVPISPARKRLKESAEVQVIDVIDISDD